MRALLIAAALFVAAPAVAQPLATQAHSAPTRAVLADAANAPSGRTVLDGATWRCEGAACVATGGNSQPAARACRRVKARLGTLTEFAWKGETLSAEQLATCNA